MMLYFFSDINKIKNKEKDYYMRFGERCLRLIVKKPGYYEEYGKLSEIDNQEVLEEVLFGENKKKVIIVLQNPLLSSELLQKFYELKIEKETIEKEKCYLYRGTVGFNFVDDIGYIIITLFLQHKNLDSETIKDFYPLIVKNVSYILTSYSSLTTSKEIVFETLTQNENTPYSVLEDILQIVENSKPLNDDGKSYLDRIKQQILHHSNSLWRIM